MSDGLKLTTYFGERDRVGDRFLADHLLDIYDRRRVGVGVLIRGVEGFGVKHRLRTDRLLTLSEDLPIVAAAVDEPVRIEEALADVLELEFDGLVTLERTRLLGAGQARIRDEPGSATKLTLYLGRGARGGGRPAHAAVLDVLNEGGVDGATVLLGVDGMLSGVRRRARFWSPNAEVPLMVISVAPAARLTPLLPRLKELAGEAGVTAERVQVLKRDGRVLREPEVVPGSDSSGLGRWQKLMLYSSEHTTFGGHPVHIEAVRRLRRGGAAGATCLRGTRGFDGRHAPHGDTFLSLRRRVPTLTVVVDTPAATGRWFEILDAITPDRGLITSEVVPGFRATGPELRVGGLRLADRLPPWS